MQTTHGTFLHRHLRSSMLALIAMASLLVSAGSATAQIQAVDGEARVGMFRITVTNATKGQVLSPPLAVLHRRAVSVFSVGQPALSELATLAEDGATGPLAEVLAGIDGVSGVGAAPGPVPPGASVTWDVEGMVGHRFSVVGMLVNTNDAFFAVNGQPLSRPRFSSTSFHANAYDAGSEENNEDCDFIPGPACAGAGAGVRAEAGAEGFVYISNGVQGFGDLDPTAYDWRNPTVNVTVQRIR